MNLKQRFSLFYSLLFCVLLALSLMVVYFLYADTRQDEFREKLENKAKTTFKLLVEVKEIDNDLLAVIDRNTINSLYDEKVLVFDSSHHIIYSSLDDKKITYSESLLDEIEKDGELFTSKDNDEILGIRLYEGKKPFIIMASAFDKHGKSMLDSLKYILIGVFVFCVIVIWFATYYFARKTLMPLDMLKTQVQNVTENNLNQRIAIESSSSELSELSDFFNLMLDRLHNSFRFQKNFIHHASHELRTPLTTIKLQIENAASKKMSEEELKLFLSSISQDQKQLSDLLDALLLLSKFEGGNIAGEMQLCRIDEIIFKAVNYMQMVYKDARVQMDFGNDTLSEDDLTTRCSENLLAIAFTNMLKNAYNYSSDKTVQITVTSKEDIILICFENNGPVIEPEEARQIFEPFERGKNAIHKKGYGLGLSITKRIMDVHGGRVYYQSEGDHTNRFCFEFLKND